MSLLIVANNALKSNSRTTTILYILRFYKFTNTHDSNTHDPLSQVIKPINGTVANYLYIVSDVFASKVA